MQLEKCIGLLYEATVKNAGFLEFAGKLHLRLYKKVASKRKWLSWTRFADFDPVNSYLGDLYLEIWDWELFAAVVGYSQEKCDPHIYFSGAFRFASPLSFADTAERLSEIVVVSFRNSIQVLVDCGLLCHTVTKTFYTKSFTALYNIISWSRVYYGVVEWSALIF